MDAAGVRSLAEGVRLLAAGVRLLAAGVRSLAAGVRSVEGVLLLAAGVLLAEGVLPVVEGVLLLAAGVLSPAGVRVALAALRLPLCVPALSGLVRAEIWPEAALLEARLVVLEGEVRVAEPVRGVVVVALRELSVTVPRLGAAEVLPSPLEVTVLLFRLVWALVLGAAVRLLPPLRPTCAEEEDERPAEELLEVRGAEEEEEEAPPVRLAPPPRVWAPRPSGVATSAIAIVARIIRFVFLITVRFNRKYNTFWIKT